jgi:non-lysosomal glucosylceramidase
MHGKTLGDEPLETRFDRRTFLRALGALALLPSACGAPELTGLIPANKGLDRHQLERLLADRERQAYRGDALTTLGMPCGGICAGQLYVVGDGGLGYWWIANNVHNTGYGHLHEIDTDLGAYPVAYTTKPYAPPQPIEQGFAVRVDGEVWALRRDTFSEIAFYGEYPVAEIHYGRAMVESRPSPPVDVMAEIFSPFVPLDSKNSALPCTVLRYRVTNSSRRRLEVGLAGWLENPVMAGYRERWNALARNRALDADGVFGVAMDVVSAPEDTDAILFEDFESGYANWTVEGDAFGAAPAQGALQDQQEVAGFRGSGFVNTYRNRDSSQGRALSRAFIIERSFICFLIGGGDSSKTAIRLLVDGHVQKVVPGTRSETLSWANMYVGDLLGRTARLEIVDLETGPWGHILLDHILFSRHPRGDEAAVDTAHQHFGNVSLATFEKGVSSRGMSYQSLEELFSAWSADPTLAGPASEATCALAERRLAAIASTITLEPGESHTFEYALSWFFPNQRTMNRPEWGALTGEGPIVGHRYCRWFGSSSDVVRYVAKNRQQLVGDTLLFRDTLYDTSLPYWLVQRLSMPLSTLATGTAFWERDGAFRGYEGSGSCEGNCMHVWNYEQGMARLFPDLERSVRVNQDFNPREGYDEKTGAIGFRGSHNRAVAMDGMCGLLIRCYREHLCSSNETFLRENYPRIKRSLRYLMSLDGEAQSRDGLHVGSQHTTYDIALYGANPLVATLYQGALRAGAAMASVMSDQEFCRELSSLASKARQSALARLWQPDLGYFTQDEDPGRENQVGRGCLSDQIFGHTLARQAGLGSLYPSEVVRTTLESIWRHNWAPDIGPYAHAHAPERWFCYPSEAGLINCTWPHEHHPGKSSIRYRNEVWTGVEYQLATAMFHEGLVAEAVAIVRAVHERYDGVRRNPFNEVECGDHYARSLASWGCLIALSGFEYDGPAGRLGFSPRIEAEHFKVFFSAAEGWGSFEQRLSDSLRVVRLSLRWGELALATLALPLQAERRVRRIRVDLDGQELAHRHRTVAHQLLLETKMRLTRGSELTVSIELA